MDTKKDRREEELSHQAEHAKTIAPLKPTPSRTIERFRRSRLWWIFPKECVFRNVGDACGKRILDFGCGTGEISTELGIIGASVTGIDISPELIELAEKRASLNRVSGRVEFMVRDIEESPLAGQEFDAFVCYAVLHHLDIRSVFPHLLSALREGGVAIIYEPIAFSHMLQKIRKKVPIASDGGPLDRPLTTDDVKYLESNLRGSRVFFFDLFARLRRFVPDSERVDSSMWRKAVYVALGTIDRALLWACPPLSRYCGTIVIVGRRPPVELDASSPLAPETVEGAV